MAFPHRANYARPGFKPVLIRSDPEFEGINDALFGKPRAQPIIPGANDRASSPPSEQSLPSSPPRKFRKSDTKKRRHGLVDAQQPKLLSERSEIKPSDERDEDATSIKTTSTVASRGGGKKKRKPALTYDNISATVRKAVRPQIPHSKLPKPVIDMKNDPEMLRFEAEMEALKNYTLNVEYEDDYWRETRMNAERDRSEEYARAARDLNDHAEHLRYQTPLINLNQSEISTPRRSRVVVRKIKPRVTFASPSTEIATPTRPPRHSIQPAQPSGDNRVSSRLTINTTPGGPLSSTPINSNLKNRQLDITDMSPIVSASRVMGKSRKTVDDVVVPPNVAKDIAEAADEDWVDTSKSKSPVKPVQRRRSSRKKSGVEVSNDAAKTGISLVPRENDATSVDAQATSRLPEKDTVEPVIASVANVTNSRIGRFKKPTTPSISTRRNAEDSEIVEVRYSMPVRRGRNEAIHVASPSISTQRDAEGSRTVEARFSMPVRRRKNEVNDSKDDSARPNETTTSKRASERTEFGTVVVATASSIFPIRHTRASTSGRISRNTTAHTPAPGHVAPAGVTPASSVHSNVSGIQYNIQRESLFPSFFSPAVVRLSEKARDSLTQSRNNISRASVRRSVVQGTHKSPLNLLLEIATPNRIINTDHLLEGEGFTDLTKIGEGSFADVYSAFRNGEEVVLKIVPVDGKYADGQAQTSLDDILSESIISIELTKLLVDGTEMSLAPVFAKTHFIKVAEGLYPDEFCDRHDSFARNNPDDCLNQHPLAYERDQRFVIIGLKNGGQDLENFPLADYLQARSVFQQVALGLAIAEDAAEFEHRDLHISNILVRLTTEDHIPFRWKEQHYNVPTHGLQVTIIDCTLSRIRQNQRIIFKDLSSEKQIFDGEGDIQYDVYRAMRDENDNDWSTFQPHTNVLWLKYLQKKLVKEKTISRGNKESQSAKRELERLGPKWKCPSAGELVKSTKMFSDLLAV
ncbi:uncharacterized protein LOC129602607 [Paramacrobiotus metropolitanus]|uniref:uncharacterized protein LOC129602607 n=1 Tax=Paramacrobiotus metropolitanus TaxID=2943436 RepID=UPI00244631F9|nr:uncharacterized protein LOC129602607 [Paramacrobiotus metropolitanus]